MRRYRRLLRTTLGRYLAKPRYARAGVYVIACYPSVGCLYIGISGNVSARLRQHMASSTPLANFLRSNMADACGFRLDVLIPPAGTGRQWLADAERRLVQALRPVFNEQHLGEE